MADTPSNAPRQSFRPIVGIGASAGGVEALEYLFRSMPGDIELAFVVVTHLAPNRESHLAEVVGRTTNMPVAAIADGEPVETGRVYILPAGATVTITDGALHLASENLDRRERHPIDIFFASLAADQGENAIGIVLSGSGSDGTLGLKAIREKDGLTIAQGSDGTVPSYPGMPTSAIESGIVDLVLSANEIGPRLAEYLRLPKADLVEHAAANETVADIQRDIAALLRKQMSHDFSDYKSQTFMRRVDRRRRVLQLADVDAYLDRLRRDTHEVRALFRDLLIGVTSFFRDPAAFERLNELVIPKLFDGKCQDDIVRVWVPACATGEEVYSLAMLLFEHMDKLPAPPGVQVFGTDIDSAALGVARAGSYPPALLEGVSPERLARFFVKQGARYHVVRELRDVCIFSDHSLIRDPPFSRIDLVSCRNLLIYMRPELQERVFPIFHYALKPSGYLFLGTSESATRHRNLFTSLDKKERVFQRRSGPTAINLPIPNLGVFSGSIKAEESRKRDGAARVLTLRQTVEDHVLDRFAPAHVVVDREGNIVYYSARTGKYLEAAPGLPSQHLLALARKSLRLEIGAALKEATEQHRRVERQRVAVEIDDRVQFVNLIVEPIGGNAEDPLYLVLFADVGPPLTPAEATPKLHAVSNATDAAELKRELRDTRERLQSTIEEYETSLEELKSSNEEMLSVNEEMQSTNEELESSKEELQSINEELHTVNSELSSNIDELNRANSDLQNVFDATRIAIVFLDCDLRIRNFTPMVTEVFNLIPTDHGRPLSDIVSNLDAEVWDDIQSVLRTRRAVDRRVGRKDDASLRYLMRIVPYWGKDRELDGLILTFVDITSTIQAEAHLHTLVEELNHRVKNMLAVVVALVQMSKKSASSIDGFAERVSGRVRSLAKAYELISAVGWKEVRLRDLFQAEVGPFAVEDSGHVRLDGPDVSLRPRAALAFGLIFHEICTNAVKYGALSTAEGKIAVAWKATGPANAPSLAIEWVEGGGPSIKAPRRPGFGTDLIRREVESELKGTVAFDYRKEGLKVTLAIPLDPELVQIAP